jgi:hypothetical protein
MSRVWLRSVVIGGWIASLAVIVAVCIALNASISTTALFLALGIAPAFVALFLAVGAPSRSVAEILHSIEARGDR